MISSFIWKNNPPRISLKTLTQSKDKGGLAHLGFQLYYWAAQIKLIISWVHTCRSALWRNIKENICQPISLTSLPFVGNIKSLTQNLCDL